MITAVTDTGPLIHLGEIDSLDIFSTLDEVFVPATVHQELQAGEIPQGFDEVEYELIEADDVSDWTEGLDAGEAAALAIASDEDAVLLTDDLEARQAAKGANIEVHGSIGLIALSYGQGKLDRPTAIERMRALQAETSLFLSDEIVERGINLLDAE